MNAPMNVSGTVPSFADVEDAARRLAGHAAVTPVIENAELNARAGRRVLLKPECLQVSGSFKFRGAYNRVSRLSEDERRRGVVAYSSGNHAQGVAAAARLVGAPAVIVMPSDAPKVKVEGVRAFGGEVRLYDRWTESREAIGAEIARERGSVLVPPFDDRFVIAGQGTAGLEFARQAEGLGAKLDAVLVPASGGGLVAGVGLALQALSPTTRVFCVEPADFNDHQRSLAAGERTGHGEGEPSMCDALMAPMPGEITFAVNRTILAGGLTASEAEVAEAVRFAFRWLKLVVEPGGAVGLAALLAGRVPAGAGAVGVVLSGGNVDPELYGRLIKG